MLLVVVVRMYTYIWRQVVLRFVGKFPGAVFWEVISSVFNITCSSMPCLSVLFLRGGINFFRSESATFLDNTTTS